MDLSEYPSAGPSQPAKKRTRTNVTKACLNCRRRKAKCGGQQPSCATCIAYNDVCAWAGDAEDGRKPASRQYVVALENRIKALEAQLSRAGHTVEPHDGSSDSQSGSDEDEPTGRSVEQATQSMLHLYMGNAGEEVHFHGPTSAFAHSSTARRATGSALDFAPEFPLDAPHDYRRHLPSSVKLSSTDHNRVLDRFFRFFAAWGMRATAKHFHADLIRSVTLPPNTPPVRFTYYSPFLHNIILALALCFADDPELRSYRTRCLFADEADKYMKIEMSRPVLATVQALAMKSSWHSLAGQHSAGWIYFGLAERLSHSMGLHLDCAHLVAQGRMSEAEMILRRDTFWNIFCQEQCWSVYIGRCHSVQEYSTPLPTVDSTLDQIPWRWDDIEGSTAQEEPPQPSMYSTTFVESAKLGRIMQKVMATLYSLTADMKKIQKQDAITKLGLSIDTWSEQLPPSLVISSHSEKNALPHIIMLQLAKEWLIILTYRPYYRPIIGSSDERHRHDRSDKDIHTVAVQRCDRSAARINQLLRIYENRIGLRYSAPTLTNIAFTAGTTHLLAAVHARPVKAKTEALDRAQACSGYLRLVAQSWTSADLKAGILDSLIKDYVPDEEKNGPSTTSRPPAPIITSPNTTSTIPTAAFALPTPTSSASFGTSLGSQPDHSPLQAMIAGFQRNRAFSTTSEDQLNSAIIQPPPSFSPGDTFQGSSFRMTVDDPNYFTNSVTGLQGQMYQGGNGVSGMPNAQPPTSSIDPFLQSLFAHIAYPPYQATQAGSTQPIEGQGAGQQTGVWDQSFLDSLFGTMSSPGQGEGGRDPQAQ